MAEPSGKRGRARGRVVLLVASFALAVFSTAGFAFAAAPMLDAHSEFPGALADAAAMPEQADGAGTAAAEGEAAVGAGDAAGRAADGSQASDLENAEPDGKSDAKGDAKATTDEGAEADADADAEDGETGGTGAAGSSRPAAGGSSAGARPSAGASAASAAASNSEPASSEPTAEELAAAEEAARQERYQVAAHEFEQTCLTTRDINNMLSICAQSLPVTGYESGGVLRHFSWSTDLDGNPRMFGTMNDMLPILNDAIAECDRHQGMSFCSEEFPELNGYAAQMQTYWQDATEAAYLLQAFVNNYNNCPGETSDGENYACCVGPLQGHLMVGPYGGATLDYIESAEAIWHQVTDTWVWGY